MAADDSPLRHSGTDLDTWQKWPGEADRLYCTYCGSMPPEVMFEAVEAGEKVIPTDKNYKIYVGDHRKFYFQHLDEAMKMRFILLLNDGRINFGEPGYFYRLPYFIGPIN